MLLKMRMHNIVAISEAVEDTSQLFILTRADVTPTIAGTSSYRSMNRIIKIIFLKLFVSQL